MRRSADGSGRGGQNNARPIGDRHDGLCGALGRGHGIGAQHSARCLRPHDRPADPRRSGDVPVRRARFTAFRGAVAARHRRRAPARSPVRHAAASTRDRSGGPHRGHGAQRRGRSRRRDLVVEGRPPETSRSCAVHQATEHRIGGIGARRAPRRTVCRTDVEGLRRQRAVPAAPRRGRTRRRAAANRPRRVAASRPGHDHQRTRRVAEGPDRPTPRRRAGRAQTVEPVRADRRRRPVRTRRRGGGGAGRDSRVHRREHRRRHPECPLHPSTLGRRDSPPPRPHRVATPARTAGPGAADPRAVQRHRPDPARRTHPRQRSAGRRHAPHRRRPDRGDDVRRRRRGEIRPGGAAPRRRTRSGRPAESRAAHPGPTERDRGNPRRLLTGPTRRRRAAALGNDADLQLLLVDGRFETRRRGARVVAAADHPAPVVARRRRHRVGEPALRKPPRRGQLDRGAGTLRPPGTSVRGGVGGGRSAGAAVDGAWRRGRATRRPFA